MCLMELGGCEPGTYGSQHCHPLTDSSASAAPKPPGYGEGCVLWPRTTGTQARSWEGARGPEPGVLSSASEALGF